MLCWEEPGLLQACECEGARDAWQLGGEGIPAPAPEGRPLLARSGHCRRSGFLSFVRPAGLPSEE